MTVTIDRYVFTFARYDDEGDVLYLHIGEPRPATPTSVTPEHHLWRLDENGEVIGLTVNGIRGAIERDGEVRISLPRLRLAASAISPALTAC